MRSENGTRWTTSPAPHPRRARASKQTASRRTAPPTRQTGRETGRHNETDKRGEARNEMNRNGQKRTGWDENKHEASSRECPETALTTSETSPETDTMEQIDQPQPRENEARTDQANNRHTPTTRPRPAQRPHRSTPRHPTRRTGRHEKAERNEERNGKQRDGTERRNGELAENTRRRTIRNHGYKQRPAEDL